MATKTVRLDGAGDYTSVTAACTAAAIGDTISITQAGTYTSEAPTIKANQVIRNDSNGKVILSDIVGRATYMISISGNGAQILGGNNKIQLSFGVTASYLINGTSRTGLLFQDIELAPTGDTATNQVIRGSNSSATWIRVSFPTPCTRMMLNAVLAGTHATTCYDCDFDSLGTFSATYSCVGTIGGTGSSASLYRCTATNRIARMAAGNTLTMQDCYITGTSWLAQVPVTLGVGYSVTLTNCGATTGILLAISAGATADAVNIFTSCAQTLVQKTGSVGVFTGNYNVYNTTGAGTTSATDVSGITDFQLDGPQGISPKYTSPLRRVIPIGTASTSTLDFYGQTRNYGGQQQIGPVQGIDSKPLTRIVPWKKQFKR